jgi:hypothetical protein
MTLHKENVYETFHKEYNSHLKEFQISEYATEHNLRFLRRVGSVTLCRLTFINSIYNVMDSQSNWFF